MMLLNPEEAKGSSQQQSVAKRVGKTVLHHKRHFEKHSNLKDGKQQVLSLSWDNVVLGRILGQGGFSDVHEVFVRRPDVGDTKKGIASDASTTTTETFGSEETSVPVAAFFKDNTTYALKHLKPSTIAEEKTFRMGVIDLFYEGMILSRISHKNIVSLHAVSQMGVPEAYLDGGHGYFIVIDVLQETLSERIKEWRYRETNKTRSRSIFRRRSSSDLSQEHHRGLYRRLDTVALPVARAMRYLHEHRILFRDLKPSNIGFTQDGTVKLFDFGLAREIIHPNRRMTGNTGSAKYMSPEVARREHYGLPADVYSFGVLLWELCSLETPYDGMSRYYFKKVVVRGGQRPVVDSAWSEDLQSLIQDCWDKNPSRRPEFDVVCESLQKITTKDDWLSVSRHKMGRHKMGRLRIRNKPKDEATFEDTLFTTYCEAL